MTRFGRWALAVLVGLVLLVVCALALIQRFHLYPGLARIWE